jgi:hypothetical protein
VQAAAAAAAAAAGVAHAACAIAPAQRGSGMRITRAARALKETVGHAADVAGRRPGARGGTGMDRGHMVRCDGA